MLTGTILVSGSNGLVGSAVVRTFHAEGFQVVGIDNDLRSYFFGGSASTHPVGVALQAELPRFRVETVDIRDRDSVEGVFRREGREIKAVVHAAAQPSHDWAAREPFVDFDVNAVGTLNLLEFTRNYAPEADFIFMSTNKVYGDLPNTFEYSESDKRFEPGQSHPYSQGFDESLSIDQSLHSLFGVSKVAADLMVQEYGRYFDLRTVVLRGGCLTGKTHRGAELHGFLSYLVRTAKSSGNYTVFGHGGKQVRDNIASEDVASAILEIVTAGVKTPGAVYNLGGEDENVSVLEAANYLKEKHGLSFEMNLNGPHRKGDHIWYVTNMEKFRQDYPSWVRRRSVWELLDEMVFTET